VRYWAEQNVAASRASYLYDAWLDAGGSIEAVSGPLLAWVAEHGTTPDAEFVYNAWLDRGGSIEAVSAPLRAWVADHGTTPQASHVYKAWLDRGGSIEAVSAPLFAWVADHGTTADAQFLYKAWLDRGGSIEAVSAPLLAWVAEHGTRSEADFVYKAWLDRDGDFESIREQVFGWILSWRDSPDLGYLAKRLSKMAHLPEPIILAIAQWCAAFPAHEDSLYRLLALCGHLGVGSLTGAGVTELLRCIDAVVLAKIGAERLSILDRMQLWGICVAISRGRTFNLNPRGVVRSIAAIIASGKVFDIDLRAGDFATLQGTHRQIGQMILFGLRWGELSIARDACAIASFAAWARASEADPASTVRLFSRLNAEFPSPVWR
jgi:hypothetical protein